MDLNSVRAVKDIYAKLEGSDKDDIARAKAIGLAALRMHLPALCDLDLAAVSWFVADVLRSIREIPAGSLGGVLTDSAGGYAMATVDLLGWGDE